MAPPYDFAEALRHRPEQRMNLCVDRVRRRLIGAGEWNLFGMPPVPDTEASEAKLQRLS